ncbi:hypothetical protein PHSY_004141 [Pseudozyma hubeiensis SY62]|uniref:Acyltransferase invovled in MEL production n=1 Tax=Pseudozyma hubeiensis (strain SY62) TaxID=1305764 RepID=R9PEM9_PSEHS|nr:hypothetical protein PHSY_004141 [Pseudozyma hubeiensis SY62]GAC96560.1 hypothetical protein PHSY_004141 [Pseudozyma hubeiensis SY62]
MINNALRSLICSASEQSLDDAHEHDFNMSTQPPQIDQFEWHRVEADVWKRTCLGHEASASFNENIADGHTELTLLTTFRVHQPSWSHIAGTELELDQLVARARQAWIQARYLRPEAAVEMDRHIDPTSPQTMTYRLLRDEHSIQEWVDETFVVKRIGEPGVGTVDELCAYTYNRPLATKGKQSMLYLVLPKIGDESRTAHAIWNVSHAVTDGGSVVDFYNVFLQCMIDATPSAPYDSIYTPSSFELNVLPRLPRSVVAAYRQQYRPTPDDVTSANKAAQANMQLIADNTARSLALVPATSWNQRTHKTICLTKVMEASEARELLKFAKQVHSGVTYLASAATILATAETFPERKASSQGALMGMVRNARRWLSTTPVDGVSGTSTPLGSDAVFLWVPVNTHQSLEPSFNRLQDLVSTARHVGRELDEHLTTAHCISSLPAAADGAIGGLNAQWAHINSIESSPAAPTQAELDSIVGPQAPGFSSVGVFKLYPRFQPMSASARASGLWLERLDFTHLGRQVNASPWISMLTIDGRIKFQLGFDTKFHEVEKMQAWLDRTFAWMRICAAAAATTRTSVSSSSVDFSAPASSRL